MAIAKMDYTKGEWIIFKDMRGLTEFKDGHAQIGGDNGRFNVAIIPNHWNNAPANACLIAAAPDIYEALKQILPDYKAIARENLRIHCYRPG